MNNNTPECNEKCIDVCNELLAGEISAVETYDIALKKFDGQSGTSELTQIKDNHQTAVDKLRANIHRMGGEPKDGSGAWGVFAKGVQHSANLFGKESALESLQEGEKHGRDEYTDALENDDVMIECKNLYRSELLPQINAHLTTLERLEEVVD